MNVFLSSKKKIVPEVHFETNRTEKEAYKKKSFINRINYSMFSISPNLRFTLTNYVKCTADFNKLNLRPWNFFFLFFISAHVCFSVYVNECGILSHFNLIVRIMLIWRFQARCFFERYARLSNQFIAGITKRKKKR